MATTEKRPVIEVTGLKKQYKLGQIGGGTLTHDLQSWWARVRGKEDPNTVIGTDQRLFGQTFMALNGVDLTVYQGEALGIIGRNGAGKSTLLKLLSRITAPTEGEIKIRGRVASMLGSVLNLKPIISCDADGAYYVVSKARGRVKSIAETVALAEGLSLLFGAWLCFFVRESLPGYYDENRISFYGDGVFRMNLAGLRLNNSNWPHILAALRGWLLGTAAVFPLLWWGIWTLWPGTLQGLEGGLSLLACLGMFLPAYVVGKRYE